MFSILYMQLRHHKPQSLIVLVSLGNFKFLKMQQQYGFGGGVPVYQQPTREVYSQVYYEWISEIYDRFETNPKIKEENITKLWDSVANASNSIHELHTLYCQICQTYGVSPQPQYGTYVPQQQQPVIPQSGVPYSQQQPNPSQVYYPYPNAAPQYANSHVFGGMPQHQQQQQQQQQQGYYSEQQFYQQPSQYNQYNQWQQPQQQVLSPQPFQQQSQKQPPNVQSQQPPPPVGAPDSQKNESSNKQSNTVDTSQWG